MLAIVVFYLNPQGAQMYIQAANKSRVAQGSDVVRETFQSSFLLRWFFKAFSTLSEDDIQRGSSILPGEPSGSLTQRTSSEEFVVPMSQQSPQGLDAAIDAGWELCWSCAGRGLGFGSCGCVKRSRNRTGDRHGRFRQSPRPQHSSEAALLVRSTTCQAPVMTCRASATRTWAPGRGGRMRGSQRGTEGTCKR